MSENKSQWDSAQLFGRKLWMMCELSAEDLLLISSALDIVEPDGENARKRAAELSLDFEILAELAEEVSRG